MNVALINGITGNFDHPKQVPYQNNDFEYFCFNDKDVPDQYKNLNLRTQALYFKTQHHNLPGLFSFDWYIWVDGKIQILSNSFIDKVINQMLNAGNYNHFGILKHAERNCIYQEVDYIEDQIQKGSKYLYNRYGNRPIRKEVESYRRSGYPVNNGLNDCSIICWLNTPINRMLMNGWWDVCKDEKSFDQIAIQYLTWSRKIKITSIELTSEDFKLVKHLR